MATLQRPFLDSSLKKKNGGMNKGANGINVQKKPAASPTANKWAGTLNAYAAAAKHPGSIMEAGTATASPTANWTANDFIGMFNAYGSAAGTTTNPTGSKTTDQTSGGATTPSSTTTTPGSTTATGTAGQGFMFSGDYAADAQKLMTQLQQIYTTPFSYNKDTDSSYLAAKQSLDQQASLAKDQTYADMADRGILNSSVTTGQLGSIQQQSVQSLAQVVPGLEANAYNRYQGNINNQANVVQTMLGQLNSNRSFANEDRAFNADQSWREADVTGSYESPEYKQAFDSLIGAKTGYAGTTDKAARAKFAQTGKDARAALATLTGRSPAEIEKMFGGTVGIDAALANYGQGGSPTMTSQRYALDDKRYNAETTYAHGRDTVADTQWNKEYGLRVADQKRLAAAAANKGSGGSGGLTFNELLKANTNRMRTSMLGKIHSVDEVPAWIEANKDEILQLGINTVDLHDAAQKFFGTTAGGGKDPKSTSPISDMEISKLALEAAYKDPTWIKARTEDAQREIIQKWKNYFYRVNGEGGMGMDPIDVLLYGGEKFLPWLFKDNYQPATGGGGGKSVHSAK